MYGHYKRNPDEIERENRRLQAELDDQRYEREREIERLDREREQRRREQRQQMQEAMHTAATWPEAFKKNRYLFERERDQCFGDGTPEYDRDMELLRNNWSRTITEVDRAAQLWATEWQKIQDQIDGMRQRIADQLDKETEGRSELSDYIRRDDIDGWMNW